MIRRGVGPGHGTLHSQGLARVKRRIATQRQLLNGARHATHLEAVAGEDRGRADLSGFELSPAGEDELGLLDRNSMGVDPEPLRQEVRRLWGRRSRPRLEADLKTGNVEVVRFYRLQKDPAQVQVGSDIGRDDVHALLVELETVDVNRAAQLAGQSVEFQVDLLHSGDARGQPLQARLRVAQPVHGECRHAEAEEQRERDDDESAATHLQSRLDVQMQARAHDKPASD